MDFSSASVLHGRQFPDEICWNVFSPGSPETMARLFLFGYLSGSFLAGIGGWLRLQVYHICKNFLDRRRKGNNFQRLFVLLSFVIRRALYMLRF